MQHDYAIYINIYIYKQYTRAPISYLLYIYICTQFTQTVVVKKNASKLKSLPGYSLINVKMEKKLDG